jgi:hypothetical protein
MARLLSVLTIWMLGGDQVALPVVSVHSPPVFCDPTANPPQFCPGGIICPKCGTIQCKCPPPGPAPPTPAPPARHFSCNRESHICVPAPSGNYSANNLTQCEKDCAPPAVTLFRCDAAAKRCAVSATGNFKVLAQCESACIPAPLVFTCDDSTRQCKQVHNGNYSNLTECRTACVAPPPCPTYHEVVNVSGAGTVSANGLYYDTGSKYCGKKTFARKPFKLPSSGACQTCDESDKCYGNSICACSVPLARMLHGSFESHCTRDVLPRNAPGFDDIRGQPTSWIISDTTGRGLYDATANISSALPPTGKWAVDAHVKGAMPAPHVHWFGCPQPPPPQPTP